MGAIAPLAASDGAEAGRARSAGSHARQGGTSGIAMSPAPAYFEGRSVPRGSRPPQAAARKPPLRAANGACSPMSGAAPPALAGRGRHKTGGAPPRLRIRGGPAAAPAAPAAKPTGPSPPPLLRVIHRHLNSRHPAPVETICEWPPARGHGGSAPAAIAPTGRALPASASPLRRAPAGRT